MEWIEEKGNILFIYCVINDLKFSGLKLKLLV